MMSDPTIIFICVSIPAAIYIIVGIFDFFTIQELDEFFLAGRKMSILSFALNTVATNFSFLTAIFVLVFWSYSYGAAVWWTIISAVIGLLLYSISRISPIKDSKFFSTGHTIHEYLGIRYNSPRVRLSASIATVTAFLGFFIAEIYIFAGFLTMYFQIALWQIILMLACLIAFYTVLGGFKSVVKTDILQFIFILIGLSCLIFIILRGFTDFSKTITLSLNPIGLFRTIQPFESPPRLFIVMLFIINGLWQFSAMDMWQRSLAIKKQAKISKASVMGGVIFAIIAVPVILIGIGLKIKFPGEQLAPFELIARVINNQPLLVMGGLICFFSSALLSTADSNLIALVQSFVYDILHTGYRRRKELTLWKVRIIVLAIVAGALCLLYLYTFLFSFDLITFLITFFSCQIVLLPSILYSVYRPRVTLPYVPALISIVGGYIVSLVFGFISITHAELQATTPVLSLGFASALFFIALPFFEEGIDE